jgi:ElaB/YqjD/DUF883 family membrane-anchored ribosome-binding protein
MTTDNDILKLKTETLDRAAWDLHDDCCRLLDRVAELHESTLAPTDKLERIRSRVANSLNSINATLDKIKSSKTAEAA